MNAYSLKPIPILIEPRPVDAQLEALPSVMAYELCQRIIAGCVEAVKRATQRELPRLVLAR